MTGVLSGQPPGVMLDLARVEHWVKNGAQLTDKVRNLVKEAGKAQAAA